MHEGSISQKTRLLERELVGNLPILSLPSQNFHSRGQSPIQGIIAHCIGLDFDTALQVLRYGDVSTHYFIPQQSWGELYASSILLRDMCAELRISPEQYDSSEVPIIEFVPPVWSAWHAGVSHWCDWNQLPGCHRSLNHCTIGIEFHAPGYGQNGEDWFSFQPYTDAQISAGISLMHALCAAYGVSRTHVVAHSDVAVSRKTDPGPLFPWGLLYEHGGLGRMMDADAICSQFFAGDMTPAMLQEILWDLGYTKIPRNGVMDSLTWETFLAFSLHYAPRYWRKIRATRESCS